MSWNSTVTPGRSATRGPPNPRSSVRRPPPWPPPPPPPGGADVTDTLRASSYGADSKRSKSRGPRRTSVTSRIEVTEGSVSASSKVRHGGWWEAQSPSDGSCGRWGGGGVVRGCEGAGECRRVEGPATGASRPAVARGWLLRRGCRAGARGLSLGVSYCGLGWCPGRGSRAHCGCLRKAAGRPAHPSPTPDPQPSGQPKLGAPPFGRRSPKRHGASARRSAPAYQPPRHSSPFTCATHATDAPPGGARACCCAGASAGAAAAPHALCSEAATRSATRAADTLRDPIKASGDASGGSAARDASGAARKAGAWQAVRSWFVTRQRYEGDQCVACRVPAPVKGHPCARVTRPPAGAASRRGSAPAVSRAARTVPRAPRCERGALGTRPLRQLMSASGAWARPAPAALPVDGSGATTRWSGAHVPKHPCPWAAAHCSLHPRPGAPGGTRRRHLALHGRIAAATPARRTALLTAAGACGLQDFRGVVDADAGLRIAVWNLTKSWLLEDPVRAARTRWRPAFAPPDLCPPLWLGTGGRRAGQMAASPCRGGRWERTGRQRQQSRATARAAICSGGDPCGRPACG